MVLKILTKAEQEAFGPQILELLTASDQEFVPPLSARSSTTQQNLTAGESCPEGIRSYYDQLQTQKVMAAVEGDRLLAFVSYIENYTGGPVTRADTPNIYLSTLVMRPEARGKGLTKKLYAQLFDACKPYPVFTRTWHTNAAHIRILDFFGFETLAVLKDHRGPGIDTVYFKLTQE